MSENEISDFLDELFNSIPVMIETSTKTYETGIISRRGGVLLTLDRDKIPISEVISIKRKNP